MKKDLHFIASTPVKSIDVGAKTDTADGAVADLKGFHSALMIIDADAWTDGAHTIRLQESDASGSGFTDVAAADLIFEASGALGADGQVVIDGATDDDQCYIIGYNGNKRYIKAYATETSASTGAIYGAMIIPGHKAKKGKLNS